MAWQQFDPVTALYPHETVVSLSRSARDANDETFFKRRFYTEFDLPVSGHTEPNVALSWARQRLRLNKMLGPRLNLPLRPTVGASATAPHERQHTAPDRACQKTQRCQRPKRRRKPGRPNSLEHWSGAKWTKCESCSMRGPTLSRRQIDVFANFNMTPKTEKGLPPQRSLANHCDKTA